MSILKRTRKGTLAVIGAVVAFGVLASVAAAAFTAPFVAYGTGSDAGGTVAAFIGTTQVGSTTVTADGAWVIQITEANTGDVITFTLNGVAQAQTLIAEEGGAPGVGLNSGVPAATGLVLSPATTTPPPTPAPTGNAGLVGSTGASMMLVLVLGVIAAASVAGARTATRRG